MQDQRYRWKNKEIREHVAVLNGERSPTILLKNATYLHSVLRTWITANIWIYKDRIIYVGKELPKKLTSAEIIDCTNYFLVPGFIEPHAHPFQIYNPLTLAQYTSQFGTTTLVNDNLVLAMQLGKKKAFSFLGFMNKIPSTIYWWTRFDAQTELQDEEKIFSHSNVKGWIEHESVLQGGELTGWPRLLDGDDLMLHWIQETKRIRKHIEGHFPGASERTLAKMSLLGVDSDHEAMTGHDVLHRLLHGYTVSLRYSSIRPDLPNLLKEMHDLGIKQYDQMMLTTDGSPSFFYENGHIDELIRIAIREDVPIIDAYNMATFNVAKHFGIQHLHGNIATGRVANINFLRSMDNPTPVSVLAKGKWVKKDNKLVENAYPNVNWKEFDLTPLKIDWDVKAEDMQFSMPFGIKLENAVITKPYSIAINVSEGRLADSHDECFLMLLDREGKWRINTLLKGFTNGIGGFASSYTGDGDIILLGKNQEDMMKAFEHLKKIGGGIVLFKEGKLEVEIPLPLKGMMADMPISELMNKEKELVHYLRKNGYHFEDPIYTLVFFTSTHLPYIRMTQRGLYDVMNKNILFPAIMR